MSSREPSRLWLGVCITASILQSTVAFGQSPGTRAAGMAEAFVAVADDATSIYWNPAGMATGAYVSFVLDYGAGEGGPAPPGDAGRQSAAIIGFSLPAVGVGYYRLSRLTTQPATPAEFTPESREEGRQSVQGLTTSHVGVTLGQSLGDYVIVAGTVKYVQGEVVSGTVSGSPDEALEVADTLPRRSTSRPDVDLGAMVAVEQWRIGLVARNLTSPDFDVPEPGAGSLELERQVRIGAAWGTGWPGTSRLVVSADADLTSTPGLTGERRDLAAGVETWWWQQRLGIRGGVRGSTVGQARPVVAAGVSAAIKTGVYVEAHLARGDQDEQRWSVGGRVTF